MTDICNINHLDHIGIAVKNIEQAVEMFTTVFGAPPCKIDTLDDQGVKATLLEIGQTRIELLEPLSEDSPVGKFIATRGEGLHHLALNVSNIEEKLQILQEKNLRLVDKSPREGLSGTIAFIHPASVFGVLTELVEN